MQVFIEGITRKKADGTEIQVPFGASNLAIVDLDKSDQRRMKRRQKKAPSAAKGEKSKKADQPAGDAPKGAKSGKGKKKETVRKE